MTQHDAPPTQDPGTRLVMAVLRKARIHANHTYLMAADSIETASKDDLERGLIRWQHRITGDEYRAMEQGITKSVPLWVLLYLAHEYRINPNDLLGDVLEEYNYG